MVLSNEYTLQVAPEIMILGVCWTLNALWEGGPSLKGNNRKTEHLGKIAIKQCKLEKWTRMPDTKKV